MSDLKRFQTLVDDIWEIVFGTIRTPRRDFEGMMMKQTTKKPKRARTEKGYYKADDLSTAYTNEAWVGGKAPKKRKR